MDEETLQPTDVSEVDTHDGMLAFAELSADFAERMLLIEQGLSRCPLTSAGSLMQSRAQEPVMQEA